MANAPLHISLTRNPDDLPPELLVEYEPVGEDLLGEGSFAVVRLLRSRSSSEMFALKCVEKHPLRIRNMFSQMQREVRIQHSLTHPNILGLVKVFDDETYIYMVLDYCQKGQLRTIVANSENRRLQEEQAALYFDQIARGVEWMHRNSCVHRDLKLENMLLTADDVLKICDFGWSAEIEIEKQLKTICGTTAYWAPEIWESAPQDESVDLWSLGCLCYEMMAGHPPFWGNDQNELRAKVLAVDFPFPPWFSNEVCHVVHLLLQKIPASRIRCAELLTHPWVSRVSRTCNVEESSVPVKSCDPSLPTLPCNTPGTAAVAGSLPLRGRGESEASLGRVSESYPMPCSTPGTAAMAGGLPLRGRGESEASLGRASESFPMPASVPVQASVSVSAPVAATPPFQPLPGRRFTPPTAYEQQAASARGHAGSTIACSCGAAPDDPFALRTGWPTPRDTSPMSAASARSPPRPTAEIHGPAGVRAMPRARLQVGAIHPSGGVAACPLPIGSVRLRLPSSVEASSHQPMSPAVPASPMLGARTCTPGAGSHGLSSLRCRAPSHSALPSPGPLPSSGPVPSPGLWPSSGPQTGGGGSGFVPSHGALPSPCGSFGPGQGLLLGPSGGFGSGNFGGVPGSCGGFGPTRHGTDSSCMARAPIAPGSTPMPGSGVLLPPPRLAMTNGAGPLLSGRAEWPAGMSPCAQPLSAGGPRLSLNGTPRSTFYP